MAEIKEKDAVFRERILAVVGRKGKRTDPKSVVDLVVARERE